MNMIYNIY